VLGRQRDGGTGDQRDAFVGGAKQHITVDICSADGRRVAASKFREGGARGEAAGIETPRADGVLQ